MTEIQVDTGEMKALIESAVEEALDRKLQDRPTRAEVENMIATRLENTLNRFETKITADRQAHLRNLETLLGTNMQNMRDLLDRYVRTSETTQSALRKDQEDLEDRVDALSATVNRNGETLTLSLSGINTLNGAVFGLSSGDGPESLFAMIRRIETGIDHLGQRYEPRIQALEAKEAWRSNIEACVLRGLAFATSRKGIVAIGGALLILLALAGKDDLVQNVLAPLLHQMGSQP